jgi:hypothetical protein
MQQKMLAKTAGIPILQPMLHCNINKGTGPGSEQTSILITTTGAIEYVDR